MLVLKGYCCAAKGYSAQHLGMADPLTIATVGGLALQGVSMAASAQAGHEEGTQSRADAEQTGRLARQQNTRLMAGPAAMPEYTQSVQGYGMPDANGQYAPMAAPMQPQFSDGAGRATGQTDFAQQDPLQEAATAGYMQGLYEAQQAMQPNVFGVPVWFDDGEQRG
jgi:hypothetical protein